MATPIRSVVLLQTGFHQRANQDCGIPTVLICRNRHSSFALSAYTVQPKAPNY